MKKIMPVFKDDRDKIIILGMILLSMFLVFVPALVVVLFLKEQISETSYAIAKMFLNYELMLFLIALIFMVPVVGWLLGFVLAPLMTMFNVIICVLALCAIGKSGEIKVPVPYEFI